MLRPCLPLWHVRPIENSHLPGLFKTPFRPSFLVSLPPLSPFTVRFYLVLFMFFVLFYLLLFSFFSFLDNCDEGPKRYNIRECARRKDRNNHAYGSTALISTMYPRSHAKHCNELKEKKGRKELTLLPTAKPFLIDTYYAQGMASLGSKLY